MFCKVMMNISLARDLVPLQERPKHTEIVPWQEQMCAAGFVRIIHVLFYSWAFYYSTT